MKTFDADSNRTLATMCDAAEVSSNGVMWLQSDGRIMGINSTLLDELKYSPPDTIPKTIFEVNPSMSLLSWRRTWKKISAETKISIESEHITADETIYPIKMSATLVKVEEIDYAMVVTENLIAANRYEDLLAFTTKISGMGSWEWDLMSKELFFNEVMYELLEIPVNSPIEENTLKDFIANGLSAEDLKIYGQKLEAAATQGTPFEFDFSFETNGKYKNYHLNAHPVIFEDQPIKMYGTLQNVANISKRTDDMYFTKYCMDNARDMIYWVDRKNNITYANQTALDRLGYSEEEMLKKKLTEITLTKGLDNQEIWEKLKERKSMSYESTHKTKDGTLIPVSIVVNYINFRGKEFSCAFIRDLTKKKKRDDLLKMSKSTLDHAVDLVFWANEDGSIAYFNQAFSERLGYDHEEIKGMNVLDFISDSDTKRYKKGWDLLKKEKFYTNVYREMKTKSGEIFPAEMTISMIDLDGKYFSTTILRDITERKKLNQLAVMSKHSLDQSMDMVFWVNSDGSFRYFNQSFVKKSGYTRAKIEKTKIFDFFPDSNLEIFQKGWEKLKDGAKIQGLERTLRLADGSLLPCEMNISMVQFEKEEFSVTVLRDVTEKKRKENEITSQFEEIGRLQAATAAENVMLKEEIDLEFNFSNIITRDPNYKRVLRQVEQVADTNATVLVLGETGTGKELLARAIHKLSERADEPMIKVNCGALPENLIESELFGHEKGSFTGAYQQKIGKFERADRGTIFLDEIGELPLDLQAKLLRVLQEGEIERVGGNKTLHIDVRIIAATNRNLEDEVAKGAFREDLYYRLNVFPIINIPLRERREDIPVLVKHFTEKYSKKINKEISEISATSMNKLMGYDFLGNVRELENLVERAVILARGKVLHFDLNLTKKSSNTSKRFLSMEEMQKKHIIDALEKTKGKVSGKNGAATLLDMNGKTLTSRMIKLGIDKRDYIK